MSQSAIEIFFSYVHEDEALRDKLAKHLQVLQREGIIKVWHDRKITAGEDRKNKIDSHLQSADIILLLISSDFLNSDYHYDIELKRALERHESKEARVIPVILRAVDWRGSPFGKLSVLPENGKAITSWDNEDEAFTDVVKGLRRFIDSFSADPVPDSQIRTNPYKELSEFIFSSTGIPKFVLPIKPSIPPLLAYLPNRKEQEEELEKALQKYLNEASLNPFICIVHGNKFQGHEQFLDRLQQRSLPELIGLDPSQGSIKRFILNLDFGVKNLDDLESHCCKNLASQILNSRTATPQEINQVICKHPDPVMISMHLLTEDWQNQGFIILDKILQFWQSWPDLSHEKKLIIFLSIKYQDHQYENNTSVFSILFNFWKFFWRSRRCRKANKKMRDQLQKNAASHFQQFSRLSATVLPELMGISQGQVENWVRDEVKHVFGEDVTGKLIDKIEIIYHDWVNQRSLDKIPMNDLARKLENLLENITK
jgi:inactive STAND/TIR domain